MHSALRNCERCSVALRRIHRYHARLITRRVEQAADAVARARSQIPEGAVQNHETHVRNGGKGRGMYAPGTSRSPNQQQQPSPHEANRLRPHHEYAASVGGRSNAPSAAPSRTPSSASMAASIISHNGYAQNTSSQVRARLPPPP
jgi:hypothetical protein